MANLVRQRLSKAQGSRRRGYLANEGRPVRWLGVGVRGDQTGVRANGRT